MSRSLVIPAIVSAVLQALAANPVRAEDSFSWSGFYAGLNAGASWAETDAQYTLGGTSLFSPDWQLTLPTGGAQAGFGWQIGAIVLGVESNLDWRNGDNSAVFVFPNGTDSAAVSAEQNWVGTFRPTLGYAIDRFLFHITGGFAVGDFEYSYIQVRSTVPGAVVSASRSDVEIGWTAGGGVDVALGSRWSLGAQYLFEDFGRERVSLPASVAGGVLFPASSTSFEDRSHTARLEVNFHF